MPRPTARGPRLRIRTKWIRLWCHRLRSSTRRGLRPFRCGSARLPVELDVSVPVRGFRVRNLLTLEPGSLIESDWSHGDDVPLAAGRVQLAWSEFEVIDTELAVRVTRLA